MLILTKNGLRKTWLQITSLTFSTRKNYMGKLFKNIFPRQNKKPFLKKFLCQWLKETENKVLRRFSDIFRHGII